MHVFDRKKLNFFFFSYPYFRVLPTDRTGKYTSGNLNFLFLFSLAYLPHHWTNSTLDNLRSVHKDFYTPPWRPDQNPESSPVCPVKVNGNSLNKLWLAALSTWHAILSLRTRPIREVRSGMSECWNGNLLEKQGIMCCSLWIFNTCQFGNISKLPKWVVTI